VSLSARWGKEHCLGRTDTKVFQNSQKSQSNVSEFPNKTNRNEKTTTHSSYLEDKEISTTDNTEVNTGPESCKIKSTVNI
jgi:predicted DNA-binding WGR domain protein